MSSQNAAGESRQSAPKTASASTAPAIGHVSTRMHPLCWSAASSDDRQNVTVNPFEWLGVWLGHVITWALDLVQVIGPVWGTVIAGLAILLETTLFVGLVVPGDTIVVAAATGVRDPLHFAVLFVTVVVATLAGQSLGFLLGRLAGPAIRRSRLGRRLGHSWDRAAELIDRRGGFAVFVSRFLPVLHALMPVTVGMSPMRFRRFLAWAAPAAAIWAGVYIAVGSLAAEAFRALVDRLHLAGYVFAGGLILVVVLLWLAKRLLVRATGTGRLVGDAGDDDA